MRFSFLIGIILFFGLLFTAMAMGSSIWYFLDIPSLLVVLGGSIAMALMSFTFQEIGMAFQLVFSPRQDRKELALAAYFWECMVRNLFIVGILGTIIGFVAILIDLSNPDEIGNAMALGLMTVFYAFLFSAVFPIPAYFRIRKHLMDLDA